MNEGRKGSIPMKKAIERKKGVGGWGIGGDQKKRRFERGAVAMRLVQLRHRCGGSGGVVSHMKQLIETTRQPKKFPVPGK